MFDFSLLKTKWLTGHVLLGLVPALAAESTQGGGSINEGARRGMMAEIETTREDE